MSLIFEDLKKRVDIFYKSKTLVFVKRFNAIGNKEYINGYIILPPSDDFFYITDIEKPNSSPKIVMFSEIIVENTFIMQSKKEDKNGTKK